VTDVPELQWVEVAAGEAWERTFSPNTPPAGGIGSYTLRYTAAKDFGDPPIITKTPSIVDPTAGTFKAGMSSSETLTTLGAGTWACEAWRTDAGGETREAFWYLVISPSAGPPA
jgi:hypothetical protein